MSNALITRKEQVAIIGTTTSVSFDTVVRSPTYARMKVENVVIKYIVNQEARNPQRGTIGNVANVAGAEYATISWKVPIGGSGTPGTPPSWGVAMQSCAWNQTINSGSASYDASSTNSGQNAAGTTGALAVTGTYTGTLSGRYKFTATEITGSPSVNVEFLSYDQYGQQQGYTINAVANVNGTPQAFGDSHGLSLAIGDWSASAIGAVAYINAVGTDAVNVTYGRSANTAPPYCSIAVYQDGVRHEFAGCQGNVALSFDKSGAIGYLTFTFMGTIANVPVDATMLSGVVYESTIPPSFKNLTTAIFGGTPNCYTNFALDSGNKVSMRQCAAATRGFYAADITGYEMTGTIDPVQSVLASSNPFTTYLSGASGVLAISAIGTVAGNIIAMSSQVAQATDLTQGDRDGLLTGVRTLRFSEPEYQSGGELVYGSDQFLITLT